MMEIGYLGRRSRGTLPMSVANMTFLVNRLGEDCGPLQFIRELTQNGLESIELSRSEGVVVWDVDWNYFEHMEGVMKLACIDTGIGMTGPEMVRHINALSSSIHEQSASGNFGVGAKIAAAPRNPHGLVYMSWKGGVGHMIHLWFDPEEKVYGLKRWPKNNGEFWTPVSKDYRPKEIRDHGTMVVLLGASDEDDTINAPSGTPMRSRWVLRYLNTRYFRFPRNVQVKAREGWDLPRSDTRHNFLRVVEGQGLWLDKNAASHGVVNLNDAKAHWWILRDDVDRDSGHVAPGGHAAALFQNELYEMVIGRAGLARLQAFGVIFGTDRVVIYIEPTVLNTLSANTARTQLLQAGEPLDWQGWAGQFRNVMPPELIILQEQIGARAGEKDHKKAIIERLKQIRDLLRFSRFRPSIEGMVSAKDSVAGRANGPSLPSEKKTERHPSTIKGSRAADIYALYAEDGPLNADPIDSFNEPQTKWVSIMNNTRVPPDLDDRAAKFLVQQNLLMINADFRAFTDMVDRWVSAYARMPGVETTVKEVVHEWFEQQLIEAVMSAQALKSTGMWSEQELESLWSETALTAAVLPRWHIDQSIRRTLGFRLGSLRQTA